MEFPSFVTIEKKPRGEMRIVYDGRFFDSLPLWSLCESAPYPSNTEVEIGNEPEFPMFWLGAFGQADWKSRADRCRRVAIR